MYLVMNMCVTAVKVSDFSGSYLRNRSTLEIGVLGYISILLHKEHRPEFWHIPPGTLSIVAMKIGNCPELDRWNNIHIVGLVTSNLLHMCIMIVAALSIFQAWMWVRVGMGKFLNDLVVSNILDTKLHGLGTCLGLAVCFIALL